MMAYDTPALLAADSAPASSQVSWQTAYWILIPLAVNTMAQPSGRVLSLPAKYRTYLRCSPLICAADCLSIFIHLMCYLITFPIQDAIPLFIRERFGDDEKNEAGEEGIQAIEKLTFIRWLFFIFGSLGSGIKLMAMEGVPWTKAWGGMFLLSFLVVEFLVVLSWNYVPNEALPEGHDVDRLHRIKSRLETVDALFLVLSAFSYTLVLTWVMIDIHDGFAPLLMIHASTPVLPRSPILQTWVSIMMIPWSIAMLLIVLCGLFMIISPTPVVSHGPIPTDGSRRKWWIRDELVVRFIALLIVVVVPVILPNTTFIYSLINCGFSVVVVLPGFLVHRFLEKFAKRFPKFSRSVFITWESEAEASETETVVQNSGPLLTFLCFIMFLYTPILCVIWYWYRYNPEGTVNREWTGVFG